MSETRLGRFWRATKLIYLFLLPARFGFLAVAALGWAFLLSDQGADILRALAEYDPEKDLSPHYLRMLGFVLAVNAFALQVWYWTRQILRVKPPERVEDDAYFAVQPPPDRFPRAAVWIPRGLGVLGYLIPIAAFFRIGRSYSDSSLTAVVPLLLWLTLSLALFLVFVVLRRSYLTAHGDNLGPRQPRDFDRTTKAVLSATLLAAVGFFVWATLAPVSLERFGSASVVFLATAFWVPFGTLLVLLGLRLRFPILSALLVWAFLVSPLADRNHSVRTLAAERAAVAGSVACRPDVLQQLAGWHARVAPFHLKGDVPIFVVAAEGGGIRAAYWTASALAALQDRFPCFANHLFAISGVSGGSLGAAVFEALLARQNQQGRPAESVCRERDLSQVAEEATLRHVAKQVLSFDSLTPTLAALTQADLAQRFLPIGFPDRERALETAWEKGWSTANGGDDLFARGMLATIQADERLPSLFLNGTMVETGDRIITSNCRIHPTSPSAAPGSVCPARELAVDETALNGFRNAFDGFASLGSDISFSAASGMSARFTYVSPAGRLPMRSPGSQGAGRVVDGGYFENSGAVTAAEIVDLIRRVAIEHPEWRLHPYVILIDFEDASKSCRETRQGCLPERAERPFTLPSLSVPAPRVSEIWAHEVLSPLRALLDTRAARGSQAVGDVRQLLALNALSPPEVFELRLIQRRVPLPLGWLLSERSRIGIDRATEQEGGNSWAIKAIGRALGAGVSQQAADPVARSAERSETALADESH